MSTPDSEPEGSTARRAQDEPRDRAAVRVFPPIVPALAILLGVGLQRLVPLALPLPTSASARVGWLIVFGAIFGLGAWSVALFRLSGQNENPWKPTPNIVERGPYRVTRNPMYLQMVLVCIGVAVALANLWILLLTPLVAWALQRFAIVPEEVYLERKFGDEYRVYKRRVRRWL